MSSRSVIQLKRTWIGVTCQDKTKRLNCSISIINIDEWMKNIGVGLVLVVQEWVCKMLIFGVYSSWSVCCRIIDVFINNRHPFYAVLRNNAELCSPELDIVAFIHLLTRKWLHTCMMLCYYLFNPSLSSLGIRVKSAKFYTSQHFIVVYVIIPLKYFAYQYNYSTISLSS